MAEDSKKETAKSQPKAADPIAAENQRATLIVRRVLRTSPNQPERFMVQTAANTMDFAQGQVLSAERVRELTASPDIHVTVV